MKIIQQIEKFLNWLFAPLFKLFKPVKSFLFPEKYLDQVQAYKDALNMKATEYYFHDTKYKVNPKLNKYVKLYSLFTNVYFLIISSLLIAYFITHDIYTWYHIGVIFVILCIDGVIGAIFLRFFIASCEEV